MLFISIVLIYFLYNCSPPAPFQSARPPSSLMMVRKQWMTPLYVVWPARAATWRRVFITSAGVTSDAAGAPETYRMYHQWQSNFSPSNMRSNIKTGLS